jgi:hypothetical protein
MVEQRDCSHIEIAADLAPHHLSRADFIRPSFRIVGACSGDASCSAGTQTVLNGVFGSTLLEQPYRNVMNDFLQALGLTPRLR